MADELLEAGVTPAELMNAHGFDPAPLALLKANFNPDEPRVPAGSGRESGEWTSDDANITPVAFRHRGHGRGRGFHWIDRFLELLREPRKEPAPEEKLSEPEVANPETEPLRPPAAEHVTSTPKPSDFVGQDFGKLGTAVDNPELSIRELDPHAIERMAERGVSSGDLESTIAEPLIVLQQTEDKFLFLSDTAGVVLTRDGRVITTYPAANFDVKIRKFSNKSIREAEDER